MKGGGFFPGTTDVRNLEGSNARFLGLFFANQPRLGRWFRDIDEFYYFSHSPDSRNNENQRRLGHRWSQHWFSTSFVSYNADKDSAVSQTALIGHQRSLRQSWSAINSLEETISALYRWWSYNLFKVPALWEFAFAISTVSQTRLIQIRQYRLMKQWIYKITVPFKGTSCTRNVYFGHMKPYVI
jgi:hypothetical protein